jgi:hypothetical protein
LEHALPDVITDRFFDLLRRSYQGFRDKRTTTQRTLTKLRRFAEKEVLTWEKAWLPMAPRRRLWLWRHGFSSQAGVLYDVDETNYRQYLSDYQRERTYWINDEQRTALNNKLLFHWMMEPFADHRVETYGVLKRGRFHDLRSLRPAADGRKSVVIDPSTERGTVEAAEWVTTRLREEGELIIKPWRGSSGMAVRRYSYADGDYYVNGEEYAESAVESLVDGLDGYLVSEVIEQAEYANALYPNTANTVRVLTMYDDKLDEPFVAAAAHRIGTNRSAPLDNISNGGLGADLNPETGELSAAFQFPFSGTPEWCDSHPDTGERIEGVIIPGWKTIRDELLDIAGALSHTPYIGWDIVVTDDGEFTVVEGNNCSGVRVFQPHGPLLDDSRVRRFYEEYDVVPADN